jgi:hypothetical protein
VDDVKDRTCDFCAAGCDEVQRVGTGDIYVCLSCYRCEICGGRDDLELYPGTDDSLVCWSCWETACSRVIADEAADAYCDHEPPRRTWYPTSRAYDSKTIGAASKRHEPPLSFPFGTQRDRFVFPASRCADMTTRCGHTSIGPSAALRLARGARDGNKYAFSPGASVAPAGTYTNSSGAASLIGFGSRAIAAAPSANYRNRTSVAQKCALLDDRRSRRFRGARPAPG